MTMCFDEGVRKRAGRGLNGLVDRKADGAGWYWYRDSEQDKVLTMTYVYEPAGHMNAVWPDGRSKYVATMLGEWAGPLVSPEE